MRMWTAISNNVVALALAAGVAMAQPANLPPCKVGMRVERVSPLNYPAKILAVDEAKGSYQVKSEHDGLVDWVSARYLKSSCIGVEPKAVTDSFFIGKWTLFVGPAPHHEVIDNKGYLVVGPGAKAPPLVVNADGTYVWTIDSKTVVRGKWRPMAANELKYGTKAPAILLLKGEDGKDWEVWRNGVNSGNNQDRVVIERMDMGLSFQGTRLP